MTYDSRRYPVRQAVSDGTVTFSVTDKAFDDQGRMNCTAVRMNPSSWSAMPGACALTTTGSQGPDRVTLNNYDAAGQLLQEYRAYGITTANGFPQTLQQIYASYSYSPNGRRTSLTDANDNRAEMTWDGFDRQRRWIFPSPTTTGLANQSDYEEYGYDAVGNRTSLRKRDSSTLTFQYDNLNRMILKVVPERSGLSSTHTRDVYYGYDLRNAQIFARFDSVSGDGVTNAYDGFGRLSSSTLAIDSVSRTVSSPLYDPAGNRTQITHPDGQAFTYTYDTRGRLSGLYEGVGTATWLDQFGYNAQGLPASRSERYGSSVTYGYDTIGRLNSLADAFTGGTGNVSRGFAFNAANQITSRSRDNDAYAWNGAYNVNRGYSVNGLNQYAAAGGATFSYDANGNLTSDGANSYVYDVENRLVMASGGHNATLRYDPLGRLYEVSGASGMTRFLYDGDALVGEYNGAGTMTARYVHGSNPAADDPLLWYDGASIAGTLHWLHADHQASIVAVTGTTTGAVGTINTYDEWGIPGTSNQGRFQYAGQAWLPELGMYNNKARIYSPTLGRFMQTDPVGYQDQINLYAYAGNDPVSHIDPSGAATILVTFYHWVAGIKIGEHSGLFLTRTSDGHALFDPGGSYMAREAPGYPRMPHPSGDLFTGNEADLLDYTRTGTREGEYVRLTRINTTPEEEESIYQAMTRGGSTGGLCANACSSVLRELPDLRDFLSGWTFAPDTLADTLASSPRRGLDVMIRPDRSTYDIPPPPPPAESVTCIRTGIGCRHRRGPHPR